MAVLNNIRKRGIVLIIIIALALFAFILSSVIENGGFGSGKSQNSIATINGKDISRRDFSQRVENMQKNAEQFSTVQVVNRAWDQTLNQALLKEQVEKLGIEANDDQVKNLLAQQFGQSPDFQTNGRFDMGKLKMYIQQLKTQSPQAYQQWLNTEENMTKQAKSNIYSGLVQAGVNTPLTAQNDHKINDTEFDLDYVKIPYSSIDDSHAEVTDEEIKAYIHNHKKDFKTEGSRSIRYVLFEENATDEDEKEIKKSLEKLLDDHKTYNKAAETEETVKGFKNATDYADFLAENSDIPFQDIYHFKSELPTEYADSLFSLDENEVLGPYKDDGYWKYSKLLDKKQMADSVKLKHILISYEGSQAGQNTDRTEEEAEQLADSLLNVVNKDTTAFKDLAKEFSDDPSSKTEGGNLGWMDHPEDPNDNPIIEFGFNNKPGDAKVLETDYGYHLTLIAANKNEQNTIKLATLAKKLEPSEETRNAIYRETSKFQMNAKDGDFQEVADNDAYDIRPVKGLKPMDEEVTGIGAQRDIVKWAFDDETETGAIKRFEIDDGYAVAQMTEKTTEGLQSVDEASSKVKPILMKKKKAGYLQDHLKGNKLSEIADHYNSKVKSEDSISFKEAKFAGDDEEPKVVGHAFSLKKGETSRPIEGENGIFVIKLNDKKETGKLNLYDETAQKEIRQRLGNTQQALMEALKKNADIEDRRAEFY